MGATRLVVVGAALLLIGTVGVALEIAGGPFVLSPSMANTQEQTAAAYSLQRAEEALRSWEEIARTEERTREDVERVLRSSGGDKDYRMEKSAPQRETESKVASLRKAIEDAKQDGHRADAVAERLRDREWRRLRYLEAAPFALPGILGAVLLLLGSLIGSTRTPAKDSKE
jgi:ElaB/YqjD/DUF883 family membrane-anchored ribosome-binding protein